MTVKFSTKKQFSAIHRSLLNWKKKRACCIQPPRDAEGAPCDGYNSPGLVPFLLTSGNEQMRVGLRDFEQRRWWICYLNDVESAREMWEQWINIYQKNVDNWTIDYNKDIRLIRLVKGIHIRIHAFAIFSVIF